jgi:serine phosphatase RsbU (regulator of sigma subunit)
MDGLDLTNTRSRGILGSRRVTVPSGKAVSSTDAPRDAGVPGVDQALGVDGALLSSLLIQSPIGLSILDADLRYVWLNDTLERIGGVPRADRLGRRLSEAHPSRSGAAAEAQMRRVLETGVPVVGQEFRAVDPADPEHEHTYSTTFFRLTDPAGRTLGLASIVFDTTESWVAGQRLALLNETSARIGSTLDVMRTAASLADLAVPRMADFVTIDLMAAVVAGNEDPPRGPFAGHLRMRRAGQQSIVPGCPESIARPGDLVELFPRSPAVHALIEGRGILVPAFDDATDAWMMEDHRRAEKIREFGFTSMIVVPVRARGVVLGIASFMRWRTPEPYGPDDLALAERVVDRAALSIDNARRYARERAAALALQRSLLPRVLPGQAAVDVTFHYQPADESAGVGGDWFDVIPLSGARVALVVGDVVGHGLHAAATMGRLRAAVQTLADMDLPPDEVLARLDDVVGRIADEQDADSAVLGATCVYAVYDPVSRHLTIARAGHPAPALVSPDGTVEFPDLPAGPPLGLGGLPFESCERELAEGTLIVLYTDGLIEALDHDVGAGLDRLRVALNDPGRPIVEVCAKVIRDLLPEHPDDDVALVLARTRVLGTRDVTTWELSGDPAGVAGARAATSRKLGEWGLGDMAFTTELVVGELVTNALRHAYGPIRLRLIQDHTLICEVSDGSSTSPRLRHARTTDEGGRGLFLVAQLSQRWGARYTTEGKSVWAEQPIAGRSPGA